jgi:hypothetical protein
MYVLISRNWYFQLGTGSVGNHYVRIYLSVVPEYISFRLNMVHVDIVLCFVECSKKKKIRSCPTNLGKVCFSAKE